MSASIYELIGGEAGVKSLVTRFYDLMETAPAGAAARAIHPADMSESRIKLFEYLSGWLGGPPLFTEKRGAPMLRARHMPFKVGPDEARSWLWCFETALNETVADAQIRAAIWPHIEKLGLHMRNQEG